MSRPLARKLLRLVLCALLAGAVVVIAPRDASFGVMILVVIALAFAAGLIAGSWWAMLLVPLGMFVGSLLEVAIRDLPDTEDEIPAVFEVLFYVVSIAVIVVWAGAGVLAERGLQRIVSRNRRVA